MDDVRADADPLVGGGIGGDCQVGDDGVSQDGDEGVGYGGRGDVVGDGGAGGVRAVQDARG